jgi:hypothetical protein
VKTLAYADDINFIVKNYSKMDAVFEIIDTFCTELNAAINCIKSAFRRINSCQIRPLKMKETDSIKVLEIIFCADIKNTTNAIYKNGYKHHQLYVQPIQ